MFVHVTFKCTSGCTVHVRASHRRWQTVYWCDHWPRRVYSCWGTAWRCVLIQSGNVLYMYTKRFACFCWVSVFFLMTRRVFAESVFLLSQFLLSQLFADEARYCWVSFCWVISFLLSQFLLTRRAIAESVTENSNMIQCGNVLYAYNKRFAYFAESVFLLSQLLLSLTRRVIADLNFCIFTCLCVC